jgi:hypothetical protein
MVNSISHAIFVAVVGMVLDALSHGRDDEHGDGFAYSKRPRQKSTEHRRRRGTGEFSRSDRVFRLVAGAGVERRV